MGKLTLARLPTPLIAIGSATRPRSPEWRKKGPTRSCFDPPTLTLPSPSQSLRLRVCKITVDISSTDLVEESITGSRWLRYMASA
jgi:hypothetical protein